MSVCKIVLIGDSGAGKTSLIVRYCNNEFNPSFAPTIGIDFRIRKLPNVTLQIWDTAGQERFRAITSAYYRWAHAIFIVFSLCSNESFLGTRRWLEEVRKHASHSTKYFLVGTKADLEHERAVAAEAARTYAAAEGLQYWEVSAQTGGGVEACFAAAVVVPPGSASGGTSPLTAESPPKNRCC